MKRRRSRKKSPPRFDAIAEVKAIARERVGAVKPAQVIVPKGDRKRPKYKKSLEIDE